MPSGEKKGKTGVKAPKITIKQIMEFFDSEHKNVMIIADPSVYPFTRKIANEFGVDFEPQGSTVRGANTLDSRVVATDILAESEKIFSHTKGISYYGIGLIIGSANYRAFPILKPDETCYSLRKDGKFILKVVI